MLTAVKKEAKIIYLSIKYALVRELLNKATFFSNIFFMVLNNSAMIVQWIILFSIKDNMGGYNFKQVLLLWGLAAGTYGVAHFFFERSFSLSEQIISGRLDTYIVQPKNILLSAIASDISVPALGDIIFSFIVYFIYGFSIKTFPIYILLCITGGLMMSSISIILNSLSFWFNNSDMIADVGNSLVVNFATYPDGIFSGLTKWLLFTIIPVGFINYIPLKVLINFKLYLLMINIVVCITLIFLAYFIFYKGLRKYSSSNLMSARI